MHLIEAGVAAEQLQYECAVCCNAAELNCGDGTDIIPPRPLNVMP
jgi:hypothetical protein